MLLVFQFAGEVCRSLTHVPLPGPVLGMILLAAWLLWSKRTPEALPGTADRLLGVLGLLFIPAGVGVVSQLTLLRASWLPLTLGLIISTLLSLLVTASVMNSLLRRRANSGSA